EQVAVRVEQQPDVVQVFVGVVLAERPPVGDGDGRQVVGGGPAQGDRRGQGGGRFAVQHEGGVCSGGPSAVDRFARSAGPGRAERRDRRLHLGGGHLGRAAGAERDARGDQVTREQVDPAHRRRGEPAQRRAGRERVEGGGERPAGPDRYPGERAGARDVG